MCIDEVFAFNGYCLHIYGMDQSGSFERFREHRWSGGPAGLHRVDLVLEGFFSLKFQ